MAGREWLDRPAADRKACGEYPAGQAAYRVLVRDETACPDGAADGSAGVEYMADFVIFAAPTFLAHYVIEGAPPAAGFVYSPWFTANLRLDRLPRELDGSGAGMGQRRLRLASLGYVNATHMSVASYSERTVWTYYYSLAEFTPEQARHICWRTTGAISRTDSR